VTEPGQTPKPALPAGAAADRLGVLKTYKLFVKGGFPRSESGRSYEITSASGDWLANAAQASRKDARDAVVAAREALGSWSGATAYNRGQVLYRVAEMLESRSGQFAAMVEVAEGVRRPAARRLVETSIDRLVWYAGWADKFAQVIGSANPVAGPYFNFSLPEPTGVVAVVAPPDSSLLGFVSTVLPPLVTGNTVVALASERRPLPAVSLAEVFATSDIPGGVVNILTGHVSELAPVLASHMDVNTMDLSGVAPDDRSALERHAAGNLKRLYWSEDDWGATPSLSRMRAYIEVKTVWHPIGV
jgi:acyl-CoA reductase-like NAD-dependent aldehyde dehydrogenase